MKAFDLGNHFMRHCGGSNDATGKPDYSRYPSEAFRRRFVAIYLTARDGSAPDSAVETLLSEVDYFLTLDSLFWGVWAINQARINGCADFPYLHYANSKLTEAVGTGGVHPCAGKP
jgi:hypothetical protein